MIGYEQALELLDANALVLSAIKVSCAHALNMVLAEDLVAPIDLPIFDNAAVDGYAVRATAVVPGLAMPLLPGIRAITQKKPILKEGMAAKIMTGAPMPLYADAVVMKERAQDGLSHVTFSTQISARENVRFLGEDLKRGHVAAEKGTRISPQLIGLFYGLGLDQVTVYKPPKIAIISTGDELVMVPTSLSFGQVYYLTGPMLKAQCHLLGIDDVELALVADQEHAIIDALKQSMTADIVLLTGGMSKGDY